MNIFLNLYQHDMKINRKLKIIIYYVPIEKARSVYSRAIRWSYYDVSRKILL